MESLQSQYRRIENVTASDMVLVDVEALNIFCSDDAAASSEEMLAMICRNLVRYYFHCLDRETASGNESYLAKIRQYRETYDAVLQSSGKPEIKLCFQLAKQLPTPPKSLSEKIHHIYRIIDNVLKVRDPPTGQAHLRLYELAAHWLCSLPSLQPVPASMVLDNARKFCSLHQKRHENIRSKSIAWGEEYDGYMQKYLRLGYRPKTAKTAAKRDFIKAHPLPKNADEQLETGEFPGHSNPALRRYLQAYLNSKH